MWVAVGQLGFGWTWKDKQLKLAQLACDRGHLSLSYREAGGWQTPGLQAPGKKGIPDKW